MSSIYDKHLIAPIDKVLGSFAIKTVASQLFCLQNEKITCKKTDYLKEE